jgi:P27 family predicted phage terminase small subunit
VAALLEAARVLTAADATALALLAAAYGEYRAAEAAIREHGMVYTTETESGSVMVRPRPEVQIRSDAWRRYRSLLPEFGLSPASRSRVEPAGPAEVDNPVAAWLRKHPHAGGRTP